MCKDDLFYTFNPGWMLSALNNTRSVIGPHPTPAGCEQWMVGRINRTPLLAYLRRQVHMHTESLQPLNNEWLNTYCHQLPSQSISHNTKIDGSNIITCTIALSICGWKYTIYNDIQETTFITITSLHVCKDVCLHACVCVGGRGGD